MDKLLLSVTAFTDEMEREKARQRTYGAMHRKAQSAQVTGGRVFGYRNVDVFTDAVDASGKPKRSHVERD
jgi:DNA invertase Pin-like site-specific DNA recombinase